MLIQLRDRFARLPACFSLSVPFALGLDLLQLLLTFFRGRVHNALLETEHVALSKLIDNILRLVDGHIAKDFIDLVQRLGFQSCLQLLREGGEDLVCLNFFRILALLRRDVDCDLCVGVDSVQLDLLYASRVVGGSAFLSKLCAAGFDLVVGFVDIVAE